MDLIDKVELEKAAKDSLNNILRKKGKFRCYEIARLFSVELDKKGLKNIIVKDGVVRYKKELLNEIAANYFTKTEEGYEKDFYYDLKSRDNTGFTRYIPHSWCEIDDFIIDHHNILRVSKNLTLTHTLIVEKKENLLGKALYDEIGKEFAVFNKKYLFIPPIFIFKLRSCNI